jgi:hypothetical protein
MKTSQVGRIPRPPATAKSTNSSHYSTVLCMAQGSGSYGRGYVNPRLKREVQSRQRVCCVILKRWIWRSHHVNVCVCVSVESSRAQV